MEVTVRPSDIGPFQDELVIAFLSSILPVTVLVPASRQCCLNSGSTASAGSPTTSGQGQEPHHQTRGACAPNASFTHAPFLNQSVNLYRLGLVLSICVNVNVNPVGIYSNFYFILFSLKGGGWEVYYWLRHPRQLQGQGPDSPEAKTHAAPWGHPRQQPLGSQIPGCYLAPKASQCSLSQTLRPARGTVSLSCLALCWEAPG